MWLLWLFIVTFARKDQPITKKEIKDKTIDVDVVVACCCPAAAAANNGIIVVDGFIVGLPHFEISSAPCNSVQKPSWSPQQSLFHCLKSRSAMAYRVLLDRKVKINQIYLQNPTQKVCRKNNLYCTVTWLDIKMIK